MNGHLKDAGDDEGELAGDRKWWLAVVKEAAYKAKKTIQHDDMQIQKGQRCVDSECY